MFPAGLKRATGYENVWTTLPQRWKIHKISCSVVQCLMSYRSAWKGGRDWCAGSFYKDDVCHVSIFLAGLKRATGDENVWTIPMHKDESYTRYLAVLASVLCLIGPRGRGGRWGGNGMSALLRDLCDTRQCRCVSGRPKGQEMLSPSSDRFSDTR